MQIGPRLESLATMRLSRTLASFAQLVQTSANTVKKPFHGGNTGSNPVGDANKIKKIVYIYQIAGGSKRQAGQTQPNQLRTGRPNRKTHSSARAFSDENTSIATLLCSLHLLSVVACE